MQSEKNNKCSHLLEPVISSSPSYSYKVAMCQNTKGSDSSIFISNSYINLYYEPHYLDLYEEDYFFQREGVFSVERNQIYISNIGNDCSLFAKCLSEYLRNGFFVLSHWDRYYLPGDDCFHKNHYDEEHLIYRIDLKKRIVDVCSISFGKGLFYAIPFQDYFYSNLVFRYSNREFQFVKYNPNSQVGIDLFKIEADLNDYLNSTNRFYDGRNNTRKYGLEAVGAYISDLEALSDGQTNIVSQTHIIYDHSISTKIRMQTLAMKGIIERRLCDEYEHILPLMNKTLLLGDLLSIKYSEQKTTELIKTIKTFCLEEKIILKKVLCDINIKNNRRNNG